MEQPVWAVCLYTMGGPRDGESLIEFVRAGSRDEAEAAALNLNEDEGVSFEVTAAAEMPEDV